MTLVHLLSATLLSLVAASPAKSVNGPAVAQAPQTAATAPAPGTDAVFPAAVKLVQVDAVVSDSKGNLVTDLEADDFEVYQDGKPQQITHASYISIAPETSSLAPTTPAVVRPRRGEPPAPPSLPTRLRPEQVRRTMAVVVDDLGLSFVSIDRVRRALRKFVDTQMQPGDLVAITWTGVSMGALSQFTADKRILHAAIDRIAWNMMGRDGSAPLPRGEPGRLLVGSLESIRHVVDGMRDLPGRKSVVLFSESMSPYDEDGVIDLLVMEKLRTVTDSASRAWVVIYSVDPRGLEAFEGSADESALPRPYFERSRASQESKEGMRHLAEETGGFFVDNDNDIAGGVRQAHEDQKGYYLIGYDPTARTSGAKAGKPKPRNIKVKVKRPGMTVRSRSGFLGTPDPSPRPAPPATRQAQMTAALRSPFTTGDIRTRLTGLFSNAGSGAKPGARKDADAARKGKDGSFIDTMLHIDGRDITFVDEADPKDGSVWKKAVVDVLLITFGDNGQAEDSSGETMIVQVRGKAYESALRNGFVHNMKHPVKKPGAYQFRAVVRDATSGRLGSASQFIEVPDVGKGRLLLSGVMMRSDEPPVEPGQPAPNPRGTAAQRVFRPGELLVYAYVVMNPKLDKVSRLPRLEARTVLYRDGRQIHQGEPLELDARGQADLKRIATGGRLQLGSEMSSGNYVLQVVVTDKLAGTEHQTAAQSIDFEIAQ